MEVKKGKGLVIADCDYEETKDFIDALKENTSYVFSVKNAICNGERNFFSNIKRILIYIRSGMFVFKKRKSFDIIICWQQFFAIFYCFFCRLFGAKKYNKVVLMTFIYRKKKGLIGKIYDKFMKFSINKGKYLSYITVSSKQEIDLYTKYFGIDNGKIIFLPWSRNAEIDPEKCIKGDYLISIGRSNRDFDFLKESLKSYDRYTYIYSDVFPKNVEDKVVFTGTVRDANLAMSKSFCVIIPILDENISAGQTLLLTAMTMKKPLIITKSKSLTDDYVIDKYNAIIIEKNSNDLLDALKFLEDEKNYSYIANNAFETWRENYSIYSMGKKVADIIK